MVTAYNVAVAVTALALVLFVHRIARRRVLAAGLVVFLAASIACALAGSLAFLIAARCVQGVGAALLLAGVAAGAGGADRLGGARARALDARGDVRRRARARRSAAC